MHTIKLSKQRGLTLIELLIAMLIGTLLILGATSMFIANKRVYKEVDYQGRLAENIRCAMEISNTVEFAHREFSSLSGGERQRVVLASALAQEAQVLLLDEPTTFLDLKNQLYTYSLLRNLAHSGMSVIAVTHDLNLAAQHADRLIVLAEGVIAADGHPNDVLKTEILADIFQINAKICKGPAERSWVFYEPAKPHQLDNYLLDKIKPQ